MHAKTVKRTHRFADSHPANPRFQPVNEGSSAQRAKRPAPNEATATLVSLPPCDRHKQRRAECAPARPRPIPVASVRPGHHGTSVAPRFPAGRTALTGNARLPINHGRPDAYRRRPFDAKRCRVDHPKRVFSQRSVRKVREMPRCRPARDGCRKAVVLEHKCRGVPGCKICTVWAGLGAGAYN